MNLPYDEDYYIRGISSGKSNYENYSWKPELTIPLAKSLVGVMGIESGDTVLDYGCARGYIVKALREIGVDAWGFDISTWAIQNCDEKVKRFLRNELPNLPVDRVLLKDLCEHLQVIDLMKAADWLLKYTRKGILIVVPLSSQVGGQYVRREDDMDVTHVIRWPLEEWMHFFNNRIPNHEWTLTGSWHLHGLKPASQTHPKSCGFIQLRRHLTA